MARRGRIEAAEAALKQNGGLGRFVETHMPRDEQAAGLALAALKAAEGMPVPAFSTAALGFLRDAREGNVVDKLDRHEARLAHQLRRVLADLERTQAQRVPGELVAEDEADPR